jgi:hypothetical protein
MLKIFALNKEKVKQKYLLPFLLIHFKIFFSSTRVFPVSVHVRVRFHDHERNYVSVCAHVHVLRGHGHTAWILTYIIDMHMQHGHGHEAWTWIIGHAI